jgi:hypothetical protein
VGITIPAKPSGGRGCFATGDIGRVDEYGYYFIADRKTTRPFEEVDVRLMNGVRHWLTLTLISRNQTRPVEAIILGWLSPTATRKGRSLRPNSVRHRSVPTSTRLARRGGVLIAAPFSMWG